MGLRCCTRAFSSCGELGLLFIAVHGFSLQWRLLLQSTGSRRAGFSSCGSWALERRLSSCGTWASLLCDMWDLPGPGLEPMSPALAGRFLTTVPQGKPLQKCFEFISPNKTFISSRERLVFLIILSLALTLCSASIQQVVLRFAPKR